MEDLGSRRAATRFSLESTSCHNRRAWGLHKSLAKLRQFYFWPGMAVDVQIVVKECEVCKITKTANKNDRPPMGEQRVTERAGQRLFIDFMGPSPRTKAGNSVIFVCLDQVSSGCSR